MPVLTSTPPRLGQNVTLTCSSLRPSQFAWIVLGFSTTVWSGNPLPWELSSLGMPGCFARCSVDLTDSGLNVSGVFSTTFLLPPVVATLGTSLHSQALGLDPGINALGAVNSNAITLTIGN